MSRRRGAQCPLVPSVDQLPAQICQSLNRLHFALHCEQGKIVDAWSHGLPVATTAVGAEGMHESLYRPEGWVRAYANPKIPVYLVVAFTVKELATESGNLHLHSLT